MILVELIRRMLLVFEEGNHDCKHIFIVSGCEKKANEFLTLVIALWNKVCVLFWESLLITLVSL